MPGVVTCSTAPTLNADLAAVVVAWPTLPAALRAAVMAIISTNDITGSGGREIDSRGETRRADGREHGNHAPPPTGPADPDSLHKGYEPPAVG